MSYMNRPHSDALRQALKDHGMGTKRPSQLSDAFRLGFWAAERSLADAQAEIARLRGALEKTAHALELAAPFADGCQLDDAIAITCGLNTAREALK